MLPILGIVTSELERGNLLMNVICTELGIKQSDILDFDLYLADATPACTFGVHDEFISSGRLDAVSAVVFAEICREAGVPCQRFVNHSDVAGGSTLGNILASSIPLRGVDQAY